MAARPTLSPLSFTVTTKPVLHFALRSSRLFVQLTGSTGINDKLPSDLRFCYLNNGAKYE
jgi:hypothetical protein